MLPSSTLLTANIPVPQQLAAEGWQELATHAPLRAWVYPAEGTHALVVFEADGAAWLRMGTLAPPDPTPVRALGLEMALTLAQTHKGPVVYVGRHCQYAATPKPADCQTDALWTEARFSPRVVADALSLLTPKTMPHIRTWTLSGYSGGGTLATLVGIQRHQQHQDVRCVVSLASPLDLKAWAQMHRMSALSLSLNPSDHAEQLVAMPSAHWYGAADRKVPLASAGRLLHDPQLAPRFQNLAGIDHGDAWVSRGAVLIARGCKSHDVSHNPDLEPFP